jgi:hypothetical protein
MYYYIQNGCLGLAIVQLILMEWTLQHLSYPWRVVYALVFGVVALTGIIMACIASSPTKAIEDADDALDSVLDDED